MGCVCTCGVVCGVWVVCGVRVVCVHVVLCVVLVVLWIQSTACVCCFVVVVRVCGVW